jgi:hypothetical protein
MNLLFSNSVLGDVIQDADSGFSGLTHALFLNQQAQRLWQLHFARATSDHQGDHFAYFHTGLGDADDAFTGKGKPQLGIV